MCPCFFADIQCHHSNIVYLSEKTEFLKKFFIFNVLERFWEKLQIPKLHHNFVLSVQQPYSIISSQYLMFTDFWLIQLKWLCKIPN